MPRSAQYFLAVTLSLAATSQLWAASLPTRDELERAHEQLRAADSNGDETVTRAEFLAHAKTQWTKMDRDRSGVFTREDLPAFARGKWDADPLAALRRRADSNRDGRLSYGEYRARHARSFEIADNDRDGRVSQSELRALKRRLAVR